MVKSSHNDNAGKPTGRFAYVFYLVIVISQSLQYPELYLRMIGLLMDIKAKIII